MFPGQLRCTIDSALLFPIKFNYKQIEFFIDCVQFFDFARQLPQVAADFAACWLHAPHRWYYIKPNKMIISLPSHLISHLSTAESATASSHVWAHVVDKDRLNNSNSSEFCNILIVTLFKTKLKFSQSRVFFFRVKHPNNWPVYVVCFCHWIEMGRQNKHTCDIRQ